MQTRHCMSCKIWEWRLLINLSSLAGWGSGELGNGSSTTLSTEESGISLLADKSSTWRVYQARQFLERGPPFWSSGLSILLRGTIAMAVDEKFWASTHLWPK